MCASGSNGRHGVHPVRAVGGRRGTLGRGIHWDRPKNERWTHDRPFYRGLGEDATSREKVETTRLRDLTNSATYLPLNEGVPVVRHGTRNHTCRVGRTQGNETGAGSPVRRTPVRYDFPQMEPVSRRRKEVGGGREEHRNSSDSTSPGEDRRGSDPVDGLRGGPRPSRQPDGRGARDPSAHVPTGRLLEPTDSGTVPTAVGRPESTRDSPAKSRESRTRRWHPSSSWVRSEGDRTGVSGEGLYRNRGLGSPLSERVCVPRRRTTGVGTETGGTLAEEGTGSSGPMEVPPRTGVGWVETTPGGNQFGVNSVDKPPSETHWIRCSGCPVVSPSS